MLVFGKLSYVTDVQWIYRNTHPNEKKYNVRLYTCGYVYGYTFIPTEIHRDVFADISIYRHIDSFAERNVPVPEACFQSMCRCGDPTHFEGHKERPQFCERKQFVGNDLDGFLVDCPTPVDVFCNELFE